MDVYVAVSGQGPEALWRALESFERESEGVLSTTVAYASEVFEAGAGVCAVALVRTEMGALALGEWFAAAAEQVSEAGGRVAFEVLLAGDEEWRAPGFVVPSPRVLEGGAVTAALLDVAPDVRLPDGRRVADVVGAPGEYTSAGGVPGFGRVAEPEPAPVLSEEDPRPGAALPDWTVAFAWADPDEEWVVVRTDYGTHKRVDIVCALLLDAGIPARLRTEPFAGKWGGQFYWGDLLPIPVLVPSSRADEARSVLAAPFEDVDEAFAAAEEELEAMWDEPTWYARAPDLFVALLLASQGLGFLLTGWLWG